eukprot:TRINITY_DN860_c0_g1_i1.p1 TRINITY_DN860_c0_g1~~TRINITY_DN860_c0_g1_i1.p1  ORF type:complete len:235 (+),score=81.19 TRINITY_DN860_c0_g1_i1:48-752(+)
MQKLFLVLAVLLAIASCKTTTTATVKGTQDLFQKTLEGWKKERTASTFLIFAWNIAHISSGVDAEYNILHGNLKVEDATVCACGTLAESILVGDAGCGTSAPKGIFRRSQVAYADTADYPVLTTTKSSTSTLVPRTSGFTRQFGLDFLDGDDSVANKQLTAWKADATSVDIYTTATLDPANIKLAARTIIDFDAEWLMADDGTGQSVIDRDHIFAIFDPTIATITLTQGDFSTK